MCPDPCSRLSKYPRLFMELHLQGKTAYTNKQAPTNHTVHDADI